MKRKLFSGRLNYDRMRDKWYLQNYDGEVRWLSSGDSVDVGSIYNCTIKAVLIRVGTTWAWTLPEIPTPREGLSAAIWQAEEAA